MSVGCKPTVLLFTRFDAAESAVYPPRDRHRAASELEIRARLRPDGIEVDNLRVSRESECVSTPAQKRPSRFVPIVALSLALRALHFFLCLSVLLAIPRSLLSPPLHFSLTLRWPRPCLMLLLPPKSISSIGFASSWLRSTRSGPSAPFSRLPCCDVHCFPSLRDFMLCDHLELRLFSQCWWNKFS